MQAIRREDGDGLAALTLAEIEEPRSPGPGEVLVRIHASSLNYHDYLVASGVIATQRGRIPLSDAAGEVVAVGAGVEQLKAGDRVISTFFPDWPAGRPELHCTARVPGNSIDGYARPFACVPVSVFTKAPKHYSHEQAATLPCAALTAWNGLVVRGCVKPGDVVLTQGTGGVSLFALQFAKLAGATVIALSSSDEKLERLRQLGADRLINYRREPKWSRQARELTDGQGVDQVVDVGGPATLGESIAACQRGAHIALIGVLTGDSGELSVAAIFSKALRISGIKVGSREQQQDMVRALEASPALAPVIDRSFALAELADAFRYQASGQHFGKIVVRI